MTIGEQQGGPFAREAASVGERGSAAMEAERAAIRAMGRSIAPDVMAAVQSLYRQDQEARAIGSTPVALDIAYGDHPRHRLDLYAPADQGSRLPILLWVHGGGFVRGEKSSPDHPFNAHVGRWAAANGLIGAVMNYRLAPEAMWPAGAEDVGAAVDWLRGNGARFNGDGARIFLAGTSSGATHVAGHLARRPDHAVRGAVLLSGNYGVTALDARASVYYGDAASYEDKRPLDGLVATTLPLLIVAADLDPPKFQAEFLGLLQARLARHGEMPRAFIASGHNHFSLAAHLGLRDQRLSDDVLRFVSELI